jgi:hypothetical protein
MLDSASHATRNRRKGSTTRAIRAIASAALAAVFAAALYSGAAGAQLPEPGPAQSDAEATEESAEASIETTPTTAKPETVEPAKNTSEPFKPTETIEAESVISFPANI